MLSTETDPAAATSLAEQTLVRLREWGTHNQKDIKGRESFTIGAASTCWWTLVDPTRHLSRLHAELSFDGTRWILTCKSKNGLYVGDVKYDQLVVHPGLVFRIGSLKIVAEGQREIEIRALLLRMIGFRELQAVDNALQIVRAAIDGYKPITLCGQGDLVPLAHALHRRMLGKDRPFVVSTRTRGDTDETVRAAKNFQRGLDALQAAATGSICVVEGKLPADIDALLKSIADPATRVHLFVCEKNAKKTAEELIQIPPLASRSEDLDLVVQEYGAEAMLALGMDGPMKPDDRAWVKQNCAESVAEIEKGAFRIVALRKHRSANGAANALGMSHVALGKWLRKRSALPFKIGA